MINEILQVAESVLLIIFSMVLISVYVYILFDFLKSIPNFKKIACLLVTIPIVLSTIFIMTTTTYQTALMWETYKETQTLQPWVETMSYVLIEVFFTAFFVVCMFVILYLYKHQLISGSGNLKTRIRNMIKENIDTLKINKRKKESSQCNIVKDV